MEKKSAEKILCEHKEKGDIKKKTVKHSERVVALCKELTSQFIKNGYNVDWKLLEAAAWLHDIAKEENEEEHQRPKVVKEALEGYDLDVPIKEIAKIIKYHRRKDDKDFDPDEYKLECAILCVCDKLDKLNKTKHKGEKREWTTFKTQRKMLKDVKKCVEYLEKIADGEVLDSEDFEVLCIFCMEKAIELFRCPE